MVVLSPEDGCIMFAKVFDTYKSSESLDLFILDDLIPCGRIVAIACKDDCVTNLSNTAKTWLESMGSKKIC